MSVDSRDVDLGLYVSEQKNSMIKLVQSRPPEGGPCLIPSSGSFFASTKHRQGPGLSVKIESHPCRPPFSPIRIWAESGRIIRTGTAEKIISYSAANSGTLN
jgi:hypothetical protein